MGNWASKYLGSILSPEVSFLAKSRKRKRSCDDECSHINEHHANKKKKVRGMSNPRHIYNELFRDGVYSDITIVACGREWKLHKVHLRQCPYFASMLSGAWKEASQQVINIDVVDPNITVEALDAMFGALYMDELVLDLNNLSPILAAASHFQMDRLVDRCAEWMVSNMKCSTVLHYQSLAEQYGVVKVKDAAFRFLAFNIVVSKHIWQSLPQITVEMMVALVKHPKLMVVTEQQVYLVLLRWLYRCVSGRQEKRQADRVILKFFSEQPGDEEFLLTSAGTRYEPAFRALRLQNLLHSTTEIEQMMKGRVVPRRWISDAALLYYRQLLRVHEGIDLGPTVADEVDLAARGQRYGRHVKQDGVSWRWYGIQAGVVLSWSFSNRVLEVMRVRPHEASNLVSCARTRHIVCRASMLHGNWSSGVHSPVQALGLGLGQKVEVLRMPEKMSLPAFILVDLLLTSQPAPALESED